MYLTSVFFCGSRPDGTADPSNYTAAAYELFYEMDGYHPVSLGEHACRALTYRILLLMAIYSSELPGLLLDELYLWF